MRRRRRRTAQENEIKNDGALGRQHGMAWAEILLSTLRIQTAANCGNEAPEGRRFLPGCNDDMAWGVEGKTEHPQPQDGPVRADALELGKQCFRSGRPGYARRSVWMRGSGNSGGGA